MRLLSFLLFFLIFFSCGNNEQKQSAQQEQFNQQQYLQKGAEIAGLTQTELLKNVSAAMKKGGPGFAIEFCNLRALVLKDSLSKLYNCQIRRIAVKYRNPLDMPQSDTEKEQLEKYQQAFEKGDSLQSVAHLFDDRVEYYQPIMLAKEACLKCHGQPGKEIAPATLETIKQRYPDDKATGFALNDLRGAWKITFNR